MGCDYYLYTFLHVTTNDGKTEELEYSREPHYVGLFYSDNDDETFDEFLNRRIEEEYDEKLIFSEGKWLIKNSDLIETYKKFIEDAKESTTSYTVNIKMADVKEIKREKYGEERM